MRDAYPRAGLEANARKHILLDHIYAHVHIWAMDEIRETRRTLGVTQIELARLLGLHQSTISRMEGGALPLDERTRLALEALASRHPTQSEVA